MNVLLAILNVSLIGWIAFQVRKGSELKTFFWTALGAKLLAGIAVGLIYDFYYNHTGDTFLFFRDGSLLSGLARNDFAAWLKFVLAGDEKTASMLALSLQEPRSLLLVKVVSVFNLLSGDQYWVASLYCSFLSFLGAWFLVRKIHACFPLSTPAAAVAFLYFPSIVFWTSGVIKESLAMGSMFFLSGIFVNLWCDRRVKWLDWIVAAIAAWALWRLKYYFGAVFFAVAIANISYKFIRNRMKGPRFAVEILVWGVLFVCLLAIASSAHPNFYPGRVFRVITENYQAFYALSAPEDLILFESLSPDATSVASNAPLALLSGLFRPFVWEAGNVLQWLIALENLVMAAGFVMSLRSLFTLSSSPYRMLILTVSIYVALLCIFITLSTPNFGTLSRYRVGYLPYFIFLICSAEPAIKIMQRTSNRLVRFLV